MDKQTSEKRQKNKRSFIISVIIFIIILIACILYLAMCTPLFRGAPGGSDTDAANITSVPDSTAGPVEPDGTSETPVTADPVDLLPENPINFSEQVQINDDIYAWISIPNTNVEYPILQSDEDDLFYLRRGLNKKYDLGGVIFTQSLNHKDFNDPVTVVYGHNMVGYGDDMFCELHKFENEKFFAENEYFYIYTPAHIMKYYVVSAFKYDDRHIMNSYNFDDPADVREFFDSVLNPTMIPMNVREGAELKDDDKLVVLSTCMSTSSHRYLVCGVLVEDTRTK